MKKSLFKEFEKTYFQLLIALEKAKGWNIQEEKEIEEKIKFVNEIYQKVKGKYGVKSKNYPMLIKFFENHKKSNHGKQKAKNKYGITENKIAI